MEIRPHRIIKRKKTKEIKVGKVSVGGNSIISVQSMTNTLTTDVKGTINQIHKLEEAGVDIVRVSCPDESSTKALKDIVKEVSTPIVADIHFQYKLALAAVEQTLLKAVLLLLFYSLGLAIPFILSGFLIQKFMLVSKNLKRNINIISKTGGFILLGTGILILTNQLQAVGFYLLKSLPFLQNLG